MSAYTVQDPTGFDLPAIQRRFLRYTIYIGYVALVAGIFHGLANTLSYARIDILRFFPGLKGYYQGLTVHGVANVLVFTFAFANGFMPLMAARGMGRPLSTWMTGATFFTLLVANLMVIYAVVTNQASVLYTAYAPLQAHWTFYLGIALIVVSTWIAIANMMIVYRGWRRDHAGERIPLLTYIVVVSSAMWFIASIPVAISFLGFLLPWSLGLVDKTDPLLTRTLFWFTGHPIVYAWLLPAYVSWYAVLPRQVGGKVISDSWTRIVFLLFLMLSIPTGFHHQFTDPGISNGMKALHGVITFGVFYPSLATAFSVVAALEIGGRSRGGQGLFGWVRRLPWGDPSVTAQVLAMVVFVFGGITGLINASFTMNQVIHNTTWVPAHFHMTVGTAVAMTYVGVAYWLIPYLTGRSLRGRRLALWSSWTYTVGVLIFARGMVTAGLEGMPRRTFRVAATYTNLQWNIGGAVAGFGGVLMFLGIMAFFVVMAMTLLGGKKGEQPKDVPVSQTITAPSLVGWERNLDRLSIWIALTIALIIIAYGPFFLSYLPPRLVSPGFRLY